MRIVLVGGGAREHAIAEKLCHSSLCDQLFALPGNPGIASLRKAQCLPCQIQDTMGLSKAIIRLDPDLVVIGPEAPLIAGLVDLLKQHQVLVVGPHARPALIEGSKSFAKTILAQAGIATAISQTVMAEQHSRAVALIDSALATSSDPIVIKADGLAGGKGVLVSRDRNQAVAFASDALKLGAILIEDFLDGHELSFFALCNGDDAIPLGLVRDYKRAFDHDSGLNTGGMGAVCLNLPNPEFEQQLTEQIVKPALAVLKENGTPYYGFLFVGLMIHPERPPAVVEFNARLGDPETQVLLQTLETDFCEICLALARHSLIEVKKNHYQAVCLTLANHGYPSLFNNDWPLDIPADLSHDHLRIFHAGTKINANQQLCAAGGRLLSVTAWEHHLDLAQARALQAAKKIAAQPQNHLFFRSDIGFDLRPDSYFPDPKP